MTYHVYLVDPKTKQPQPEPILNGVTHRPASWPTFEAASLYVEECRRLGRWNSLRDSFAWDYLIKPSKGEE